MFPTRSFLLGVTLTFWGTPAFACYNAMVDPQAPRLAAQAMRVSSTALGILVLAVGLLWAFCSATIKAQAHDPDTEPSTRVAFLHQLGRTFFLWGVTLLLCFALFAAGKDSTIFLADAAMVVGLLGCIVSAFGVRQAKISWSRSHGRFLAYVLITLCGLVVGLMTHAFMVDGALRRRFVAGPATEGTTPVVESVKF